MLLGGLAAYAEDPPPAPQAPAPPAPAPVAPSGPAAPLVDQAKIIIGNKAKTDGEIRLSFTPEGGAAKEIRVTVAKGMAAKEISRDIAKELSVAAGPNYVVEQFDEVKVKVQGKGKARFSLTLAGQTVAGISIEVR
jgi:hypothetical protein